MPDTNESISKILQEKEVFLIEHEQRSLSEFLKIFSELNVMPKIRFHEDSMSIALQVLSGDGAMILPSNSLEKFKLVHDFSSFHFRSDYALLSTYILWNTQNYNPMIQAFCDKFDEFYREIVGSQ